LRAHSKYWFANVGEGAHRNWDDNRKYGFVSAGGGTQFARAIQRLRIGDKFFAYLSGVGYVGYGEVTQEAVMIRDFVVDGVGKKLLELPLKSPNAGVHPDNPDLCEWVVQVHWLKTFPREKARFLRGVPVYRNVVCKLNNPKTVDFLKREFGAVRSKTSEEEFFIKLTAKSPVAADVARKLLNWSRQYFTSVEWKAEECDRQIPGDSARGP